MLAGIFDKKIGEDLLLPETFLTNSCIVSTRSGDAERELEGEECIVCVGEDGLVFWRAVGISWEVVMCEEESMRSCLVM